MAFNFQTVKSWTNRHGVKFIVSLLGGLSLTALLWNERTAPVYFEAVDEYSVLCARGERMFAAGYANYANETDTITTNAYEGVLDEPPWPWNRFITTNATEHGTVVTNAIGFYPRDPSSLLTNNDNQVCSLYHLAVARASYDHGLYWVQPERRQCYTNQPAAVIAHDHDGSNVITAAWWNLWIGTNLTAQYGLDPQTNFPAVLPYQLADIPYITTAAYHQVAAVMSKLVSIEAAADWYSTNGYWQATASAEIADTWDLDEDGEITDDDEDALYRLAAWSAIEAAIYNLGSLSWVDGVFSEFSSGAGGLVYLVVTNFDTTPTMIVSEVHAPTLVRTYGYATNFPSSVSFYDSTDGIDPYYCSFETRNMVYAHPDGIASGMTFQVGSAIDAASHLAYLAPLWTCDWCVTNYVAPVRYDDNDMWNALAVAMTNGTYGLDVYPNLVYQPASICGWQSGGDSVAVIDYAFSHLTNAAAYWEEP